MSSSSSSSSSGGKRKREGSESDQPESSSSPPQKKRKGAVPPNHEDFICPISYCVLLNPVILSCDMRHPIESAEFRDFKVNSGLGSPPCPCCRAPVYRALPLTEALREAVEKKDVEKVKYLESLQENLDQLYEHENLKKVPAEDIYFRINEWEKYLAQEMKEKKLISTPEREYVLMRVKQIAYSHPNVMDRDKPLMFWLTNSGMGQTLLLGDKDFCEKMIVRCKNEYAEGKSYSQHPIFQHRSPVLSLIQTTSGDTSGQEIIARMLKETLEKINAKPPDKRSELEIKQLNTLHGELNFLFKEGPFKDLSPLAIMLLLGQDSITFQILDLVAPYIRRETLNQIVETDPLKGVSLACMIVLSSHGQRLLLASEALRQIDENTLNVLNMAAVPGPVSVAMFLVTSEYCRELLSFEQLRRFSKATLDSVIPFGVYQNRTVKSVILEKTPEVFMMDEQLRLMLDLDSVNKLLEINKEKLETTERVLSSLLEIKETSPGDAKSSAAPMDVEEDPKGKGEKRKRESSDPTGLFAHDPESEGDSKDSKREKEPKPDEPNPKRQKRSH